MLVDSAFIPARKLAKHLSEIRQYGRFKDTSEVSELCDLAWECTKHFSDARVTLAFILATVLGQIGDEFDQPRLVDREKFQILI